MLVLGMVLFILVLQTKNRLKPACPTSKTPLNEHLFGVKMGCSTHHPYHHIYVIPSRFYHTFNHHFSPSVFFSFLKVQKLYSSVTPTFTCVWVGSLPPQLIKKKSSKDRMVRGFGWCVWNLGLERKPRKIWIGFLEFSHRNWKIEPWDSAILAK